jgi:hypothetical protein
MVIDDDHVPVFVVTNDSVLFSSSLTDTTFQTRKKSSAGILVCYVESETTFYHSRGFFS